MGAQREIPNFYRRFAGRMFGQKQKDENTGVDF